MRSFSPTATAIYTILALALAAWSADEPAIGYISWPGYSVVRVYDRDLDTIESLATHAPGAHAIVRAVGTDAAQTRKEATDAFEEVLAHIASLDADADPPPNQEEDDHLRAHLVILLAEEANYDRARHHLDQLASDRDTARRFVDLARSAYPELGPAAPSVSSDENLPLLGWGWAARTVTGRLQERGVDPTIFGLPVEPLADLEDVARDAASVIAIQVTVLLIALGAAAYVWATGRLRPISGGVTVAPWPASTLIGVLTRGFVFGILLAAVLGFVLATLWPDAIQAETAASLAGILPVLFLTHRHLVRPGTWTDTFGLRLLPRTGADAVWIGLAALAVGSAGELGVQLLSRTVGLSIAWTDTVTGLELYGSSTDFVLLALNATVLAPLLEEIVFRGAVYPTLRRSLPPTAAILASGMLFGALHLYSPAGFVAIAWVGVVLAVTYERTRSLLPCWIAHAAANALWVIDITSLR